MLPVDPDTYSVDVVLFRMRRGDRYKCTKKVVLAKRSIDARRQACELARFFYVFRIIMNRAVTAIHGKSECPDRGVLLV
jgi:hypothetical protein